MSKWNEQRLTSILDRLMTTYDSGNGVNQAEGHDLPSLDMVYRVLDDLFQVLFPGFSGLNPVMRSNLPYHAGNLLNQIWRDLTVEVERAFRYQCRVRNCSSCSVKIESDEAVLFLLDSLPSVREILLSDVESAMRRDPAAVSLDETILAYPGIEAIATYRLANLLYLHKVPLIPRIWTERAHSRSGIDINPGATIGPSFFIDHGTGVVIGETSIIGQNVTLYQGVTLGALAPAKGQKLSGKKRHPTIEDNVIIYAGTTILGGDTVIGEGSIIGGNVWLTQSVAPKTTVLLPRTDYIYVDRSDREGNVTIRRPLEADLCEGG